jgi:uncharacterized delta-60 repeat protein
VIRSLAVVAVAGTLSLPAGAAAGANRPGFLDTRIAYVLDEKIQAVGVASGGRILVAGGPRAYPGADSRIRAYLPDGALDNGFGQDGVADVDSQNREVVSMLVQPDGRILLGLSGTPARLQRLRPDGSPDASFGTGGTLDIDFGDAADEVTDVALQPDGSILVAGTPSGERQPQKRVHLRRYSADGTPDPGFGTGGQLELPTGDPYLVDATMLFQPGGRIVLLLRGYSPRPVRIARLSTAGVVDPTFGQGGLANVEFAEARQAARALADSRSGWRPLALPDGRIRIPYTLDVPRKRPHHMAVVGLTADGHPDHGFGRRGLAVARQPELPGGESAEVLLRDGRGWLLEAGSLFSGAEFTGDEASVIRRFRPDGTPDRSFGPRGFARGAVPGGGYSTIEQRLALLDGDTLVAAEHTYDFKYGTWTAAAVRTLNAGYDRVEPAISLRAGCHWARVRIRDSSPLDRVVVRVNRRVFIRTTRRNLRFRVRPGLRVSVTAVDVAGNPARVRTTVQPC